MMRVTRGRQRLKTTYMGRLSPRSDHSVKQDCRVESSVTLAKTLARLRLKGGTSILPSLLRISRVRAAVLLVRHWTRVKKIKSYREIRIFSRMFKDPENTPWATATEIPRVRPLQGGMMLRL